MTWEMLFFGIGMVLGILATWGPASLLLAKIHALDGGALTRECVFYGGLGVLVVVGALLAYLLFAVLAGSALP